MRGERLVRSAASWARRATRVVRGLASNDDVESFLGQVRGVIHVGANDGQERELYARHRLDVLWVEAVPEVVERLRDNLQGFPRQRALQALVTDRDDCDTVIHVANNDGASSSILDLARHREIWPEVWYSRSETLHSVTLSTLLRREAIDPSRFDALVLDTQGSELLVLRGAAPLLPSLRFVQVEAADFEAYAGGCTLAAIRGFLRDHGFREAARRRFAQRTGTGSYYDALFRNRRLERSRRESGPQPLSGANP